MTDKDKQTRDETPDEAVPSTNGVFSTPANNAPESLDVTDNDEFDSVEEKLDEKATTRGTDAAVIDEPGVGKTEPSSK